MNLLEHVYTWTCFWSALAGWIARRLYCRSRTRWMDKHHPLPEGAKRRVDPVSRVWLAGAAAALTLGYVLLTAQRSADQARITHDQTLQLTEEVARCWADSYQAARAQIVLNAQNDSISRQQQDLQRDYDRATSDWLKSLVAPANPHISGLSTDDPERKAYAFQVTIEYQAELTGLGIKFDALVDQRRKLDVERAQHPLPEVTCGK